MALATSTVHLYTIQVSSPRNLALDSDTDGEWSFSMATPTCQREPQKGLPLAVNSADESTLDTSDDSVLSLRGEMEKGIGMKLRNKVVLRKGEKVHV